MALAPLTQPDPNAPSSSSGNPIIDQINSIRQPSDLQGLSQPAKDVLTSVHQKLLQGQGLPAALSQAPQSAAPVPMMRPAPAQPLNLSALAKPAAGPTPMMPQRPLTSAPMNPGVQGAEDEVNRLNSTGSGVSQIKNPWGRIPLQILDAVGSSFFPKISALLPGTELHHERLANEAEGNLKNQEGLESEQATNAERAAQTESLKNPKDEITPISTDKGYVGVSKHTGEAKPIEVNGEQAQPVEKPDKTIAPHYTTTGDGSVLAITTDPSTGKHTTETVYKGQPGQKPEQTKLNIGGKEHTVLIDVNNGGKLIKDLGETGEKAPNININQGSWHLEEDSQGKPVLFNDKTGERQAAGDMQKSGTGAKATALATKTFAPAMDSAERFNVMTNNYDDAVKNHNQQAMLSLLANHLGMTMGLNKGAKINQAVINEAENSQPFLKGLGAKFDKDGYLSGVTLNPEQMKQMVDLGRQRFAEDTSKARSEARYAGVQNDGPDRTPNISTMHHYLSQANGDVNKAKQLAAQDGWTVPTPK